MDKIKCTGLELCMLRVQIVGGTMQTANSKTFIRGILNEASITEGVKRACHKNLVIINQEFSALEASRIQIRNFKDESLPADELKIVIEQKEQSLMAEEISFMAEKFDFARVENAACVSNYQLLYDKLSYDKPVK